jgi:hypothetical protein
LGRAIGAIGGDNGVAWRRKKSVDLRLSHLGHKYFSCWLDRQTDWLIAKFSLS